MSNWVKDLYRGDEKGDSSDDELPEVVSTAEMRSKRDDEVKSLRDNKKRVQEKHKERKKLLMEKFLSEKKVRRKMTIVEPLEEDQSLPNNSTVDTEKGKSDKKHIGRKSYPSLNIEVKSLQKVASTRAKHALAFKSNRFAKVPRESVAKSIISYHEKCLAKKS